MSMLPAPFARLMVKKRSMMNVMTTNEAVIKIGTMIPPLWITPKMLIGWLLESPPSKLPPAPKMNA